MPRFTAELPVGLNVLPEWDRLEAAFTGILDRRYFANNGPLVRELDKEFARIAGAKHAVCVVNEMVGTMILAKSLCGAGEVVIPPYVSKPTVDALEWAGLTPVLADVDPESGLLTARAASKAVTRRTVAVLRVHLFGLTGGSPELENLAGETGLRLIVDAADSVPAGDGDRSFGAGESFSFGSGSLIFAGEGGCVTTNSDELADRLRTMRNFHAGETFATVPLRLNGKMSEAQAALGLLALSNMAANVEANRKRIQRFVERLRGTPGISVWSSSGSEGRCSRRVILRFDESVARRSRTKTAEALAEENVRTQYPIDADWAIGELPAFAQLAGSLLELPNNPNMTLEDVDFVCEVASGS